MSSDGDILAFQNSVEDNLESAQTVLFNTKKWNYITDSTSNSGSFGSGQIQFDLSSFASQSQWLSLSEAVIEFPVKISAVVSPNSNGTSTIASTINSFIIKNGWHQWIDSAQLMINGQTIQAAQPYENVATQWRILSSWSQDELVKQGPTCGFALDDCTADAVVTTTLSATSGLNNVAYGTVATPAKGFDCVNNPTVLFNKGVQNRAVLTNNDVTAVSSLQTTVLGPTSMKTAGRSNMANVAATAVVGAVTLSAFYMATVRLKDLCDISSFPLVKNLKGYLYLTFNSAQVDLTYSAPNVLSAVSVQSLSGRTTPFLVNHTASGITASATGAIVRITGSVDATSHAATTISPSGPLLTNARMLMPYYVANPMADAALSQTNKFFTTMEKIHFSFDVPGNGTANYTITSGVANPRRLVMLPTWKGLGTNTTISAPELSPFDSVPATSGPFAGLNQLQVTLANTPIYQYPISYDYEQFLQEQSQVGESGNMSNQNTSGLLSEQLWTQNHRFYTIDLSRRVDAEDGSSKSVAVSFVNPSATFTSHIIGHLYHEKRWVVDTATCTLSPL